MNVSFLVSDDPIQPVRETIAPDEGMLVQGVPIEVARKHYFETERSALRCIRLALAAAGRSEVRKILDLPCGHGRVLRVLQAAYSEAELHACDLLAAGMEFCRSQLGAVAISSDANPKKIRLKGPYDLIWVGSLFTHFDGPRWVPFLESLHAALAPDGVCVFTSHGNGAAQVIRNGSTGYGLNDPGQLLGAFDRDGFSYASYDGTSEYGISLSSVSWVANQIGRIPNARLVAALERGWAEHQDVYAFQRVDWR